MSEASGVPALDEVLPLLRCPHCGAALACEEAGAVVRCADGHTFDIARQGYLSLLAGEGTPHAGDTAEMVAARERFLGDAHFEPLAEALAEAVGGAAAGEAAASGALAEAAGGAASGAPACVLDIGAGTGWYLSRVLDAWPEARGLALDLSKPALRRAARAHPHLAAVACDVWRPLPLRDAVAAVVLNVFAPRDGSEIARVLAPGGVAVIVTPRPDHLRELVEPLGLLGVDEHKETRLADRLEPALAIADRRELTWTLRLDRAAARDAAAMGPSAFHLSPADLDERVAALPQLLDVTAAVTITLATAAGPRARPPAPAAGASGAGRLRTPPASRPPRSPGGTG
jgi:23S rRNA (guanine745-N1)-methyltransferase